MTLEMTEQPLEQQYIIRPVTFDDVEAVAALVRIGQIEDNGQSTVTSEMVIDDWKSPGFDLANSTYGVFTQDGQMAGYAEMWDNRQPPVRPFLWAYVHPDYRGQGIGTTLTQWGKQRALQVFDRVPDDARVVLECNALSTKTDARQLFLDNGFVYADRSWLNMAIEMESAPPAPVWSPGITVTTLGDRTWKEIYKAVYESFQDHRGWVNEPFEQAFTRWEHHHKTDDKYDPSLWFLAVDGDTIAGISICRPESWMNPDEAYVMNLGVIPAYRQQGLGLALLQHTFAEFWKRSIRRVALHVDGSSLTGAARLYEKAGMHVHKSIDAFELELRPGRELSRQ